MNVHAARALADLLGDTAPLWRPAPFHDDPPWLATQPALTRELLSLDDARLAALEADPAALAAFVASHLPSLGALQSAAAACLAPLPPVTPLDRPETEGRDVPGRKWTQLLHFVAACGTPAGPVVEWCSGKGHLGRLVARTAGCPVTSVERDAALCGDGRHLAAREQLPVTFVQADVLRADPRQLGLRAGTHAIALHACGDLHLALMSAGTAAGIAALDIAPCCYHLTRERHWQPRSDALQATTIASLGLTRDELRLAVQEAVTSSASVIARQRTLAAWRLGFDRLQRDVRGIEAYLPTPSRPATVLAAGFGAFAADMAAHHGLALPAFDADRYRQAGEARLARVRRLELVRHACRRPFEVLLVADRAFWLAGQGYEVQVRTFCPRRLTPRNLLIQARLPAGRPAGAAGTGTA